MRLRRGLPLVLFTILAVGLPILEFWLIQVGQAIGVLPTILLLVVIAGLGGWLMQHQGARAWKALRTPRVACRPHRADAVLILVGGLLLILPGFVTDVIGSSSSCPGPGRTRER